MLVALLLAGMLAQGCSDNSGRVTPTSATVTGDAIGGPAGSLFVQVVVSPGVIDRGRRASVLVLATNANGIAVPNRNVNLTSDAGIMDQTHGTTGSDGSFSTTMFIPCDTTADAGTVIAIIDGKTSGGSGSFVIVTATSNNPCS